MKIKTTPLFALSEVRAIAATYSYRDETNAIEAGKRAQFAGFYTLEDFRIVCDWKSPRSMRHWLHPENSDRVVREVTRVSLATDIEQFKIGALRVLRGVDWPTASVLLHFGTSNSYPILDYRALWSMGNKKAPTRYTFEHWWQYTEACRRLAAEAGVTMRELDRALWQFSSDNPD